MVKKDETFILSGFGYNVDKKNLKNGRFNHLTYKHMIRNFKYITITLVLMSNLHRLT